MIRGLLLTGWAGLVADCRGLILSARSGLARHRRRRWSRRIGLLLLWLVLIPNLVVAAASAAEPAKSGPAWFTWVQLKDTHGFEPWQYGLSLDTGGATNLGAGAGALLLGWAWDAWRLLVLIAAWGLDYVLQFRFLELFRPIAVAIGTVLTTVIGQIGVAGTLATASVVLSGVWILRGRAAAGMGEIAVTAVVLALLSTWVANPVSKLADPNTGAIVQAQNAGAALTSRMLTQPNGAATSYSDPSNADSSQAPTTGPGSAVRVRSEASAALLDTFIRTPHQLLNYGKVLDIGGKCQPAYDKTIREAPHDVGDDGPREDVGDACGHDTDYVAEHPQNSVMGALLMMPSGFFLVGFVLILLLATALLTALALYEAAKFSVELLKGLLPGSSRAGIFSSLATMAAALGMLAVAVTSVGVLILALQAVFSTAGTTKPVQMYLLFDLVVAIACIAVLVLAFKARKTGRRLGQRIAQSMTPKPVSLPSGPSAGVQAVRAAQHATAAMQRRRMNATLSSAGPGSDGTTDADTAARGKVSRVVSTTGKVAATGVKYTLGAPVAVPQATRAAQAAMRVRRTAMQTKLAAAGKASSDYAHEYAGNVKRASGFVATATGARHVARGANTAVRAAGRAAAPHVAATGIKVAMASGPAASTDTSGGSDRGRGHSTTSTVRPGSSTPRRTPLAEQSDTAPAAPRPPKTAPTGRGTTDPAAVPVQAPVPAPRRQPTPVQAPGPRGQRGFEQQRAQEAQQRLRERLAEGRKRAG